MSYIFRRLARVLIEKPGQPSLDIQNLRIAFNLNKNTNSSSNKSTVKIYNLNLKNRNFIEGENLSCILQIGYKGIPTNFIVKENTLFDTIFQGDITDVSHKWTGVDVISTMQVSEKGKDISTKHIEKSFKGGTRTETVIREILSSFGISTNVIDKLIARIRSGGISNLSKSWASGISLSGNFKSTMDKVMNYEGLDWFFDGNDFVVDNPVIKKSTAVVPVISSTTGLIGRPIKKEKGWEIEALIQPQLRPPNVVRVQSRDIDAQMKITEAVIIGDTKGDDWKVKAIIE